jgi:hypothetical protein
MTSDLETQELTQDQNDLWCLTFTGSAALAMTGTADIETPGCDAKEMDHTGIKMGNA